ncbi:hypothetical protein [Sphingomonas sp. AX6]|uniref:hypothetical protein n=1 Tax=Sphingomonas sp. AX6 TaxID=2653171 RepID=UPI0012F0AAAC|nr:hypothetical protein [Sphingomonas sp. AX6]VXC63787.1 hypothetical protein SPHINGOAX6_30228 [Sphingomonas sp. AX6]
MTALRTHKVVAALPPVLEPSALYFVRVGAGFDLYVTNELGLVASYKQNLPTATVAQFRNATAERLLSSDIYWAAQVPVALIDGATIAVNLANGINFAVTLGGNRTLGNPSSLKPGQAGSIFVTGAGYSLAFASNWVPDDLSTFPVLNPTGVTELRYKVAEGGKVRIAGGKPTSGGLTSFSIVASQMTAFHHFRAAMTLEMEFTTNTGGNGSQSVQVATPTNMMGQVGILTIASAPYTGQTLTRAFAAGEMLKANSGGQILIIGCKVVG